MNDRDLRKPPLRRRRTWYRRRLRLQRTLLTSCMLLALAAICWQSVARHFALPTLHPTQLLPDSFWARGDVRKKVSLLAANVRTVRVDDARRIYPYSLVPGGVHDAHELLEVAARDYVVARHFSNFEFRRARLIRSREARLVYMSYRIRDRVFWTRKKVHLPAGELLLTDGKIAARARCGNQVSEEPQSETSAEEPSEDVLDQPVAELEPMARALPFHSALNPPNMPGIQAMPPKAPRLFAGGFFFPYVPFGGGGFGLCESDAEEKWEQQHGIVDDEKKERKCHPGHHGPAVPEPASVILISSGLAAVYWRVRRRSLSS